ncbi:MAG: hypothetical protein ACK521_10370 [bacterium]
MLQSKQNTGVGFLLFSDQKIVKDFLYDKSFFYNMVSKELSPD